MAVSGLVTLCVCNSWKQKKDKRRRGKIRRVSWCWAATWISYRSVSVVLHLRVNWSTVVIKHAL